jgi:hypothetical protein
MPQPDDNSPHETNGYPAEKARQGRIVLNTPTRRAVFIAGLAGLVFLAIVLAVL